MIYKMNVADFINIIQQNNVEKILTDPDSIKKGAHPLTLAIITNNYTMCNFLLKTGAHPKNLDNFLIIACLERLWSVWSTDIIQLLLHSGASVHVCGSLQSNSLLHGACAFRDVELVALLLKNGANPNSKNKDNKTPIDECTSNWTPPNMDTTNLDDRKMKIIQLLVDYGLHVEKHRLLPYYIRYNGDLAMINRLVDTEDIHIHHRIDIVVKRLWNRGPDGIGIAKKVLIKTQNFDISKVYSYDTVKFILDNKLGYIESYLVERWIRSSRIDMLDFVKKPRSINRFTYISRCIECLNYDALTLLWGKGYRLDGMGFKAKGLVRHNKIEMIKFLYGHGLRDPKMLKIAAKEKKFDIIKVGILAGDIPPKAVYTFIGRCNGVEKVDYMFTFLYFYSRNNDWMYNMNTGHEYRGKINFIVFLKLFCYDYIRCVQSTTSNNMSHDIRMHILSMMYRKTHMYISNFNIIHCYFRNNSLEFTYENVNTHIYTIPDLVTP